MSNLEKLDERIVLDNFEKWVTANKPNKFGLFDYIHAISNSEGVKPDFIFAVASLLWPEFHEYEVQVFLKEEFTQNRYDKLKSNGGQKSVEQWINSLALSEMFSDVDFGVQKLIGDKIVEAWRAKLKLEFPEITFTVLCEEDDPEDLWCSFFQTES